MTAKDFFETKIPALFAADPQKYKGEPGKSVWVKVCGLGGGEWTVTWSADTGLPRVTAGVPSEVSAKIEMSDADFAAIIEKPSCVMGLYLKGAIKISGESMLVMKFAKLFG